MISSPLEPPRSESTSARDARLSILPAAGGLAGAVGLGVALVVGVPEVALAVAHATQGGRLAALAWASVGVLGVASSALVVKLRRERDEARAALSRWVDGESRRRDAMDYVLHDMKGPITTLQLVADVLHDESHDEGAATAVRETSETLRRMVFNLLDLSRAADGALATHRRPVDISALLAAAQESASRATRLRGQPVVLECHADGCVVDGDADVLGRVLDNLLSNAIKFSRAAAPVRIHAGREADGVTVRVIDRAPQIPEDVRGVIFEKFVRLTRDAERQRASSHGLGLAFCKQAIEAHGGSIHVEPDARGGNSFVVWLPARC